MEISPNLFCLYRGKIYTDINILDSAAEEVRSNIRGNGDIIAQLFRSMINTIN